MTSVCFYCWVSWIEEASLMAVLLANFFNYYCLLLYEPSNVVYVELEGSLIGTYLKIKSNPPIYSSWPVSLKIQIIKL
jgi:hypothetical protein